RIKGARRTHKEARMKRIVWLAPLAIAIAFTAYAVTARGQESGAPAPVYGVRLPEGYRDWRVISVAAVGGEQNDLRVKLGNDIAIDAYRRGARSFPDGAIIARLAYQQTIPEADNELLRGVLERRMPAEQVTRLLSESRIAGAPTNVQFMVKD